ncbi:LytTR family two component transcriptional regulator [Algoriphagus ratkowskyi]|uniref:LytTR family two component transcriptional regulator n=1 Tax=Algoriphagus ratkowskyi TaxID=57028 RepID=A0A2W7RNH7_9BACT|nr:LytTR family DNA-binding domain-containing protein [Algoriphagus ratkowskyi]PZX56009.1 LytTR family two component transcriptional regulator [Algoriphagus ratkowskyi]TXD77179.1 response regulator transcription factor [Algoriphagus ratkowskyi]
MKDLIRIISVESEAEVLESLKHILENTMEGAQLLKNYSRPDNFLQDCKRGLHDFDLLFLNFEMFPFKGIELINEMKKNTPFPHFDIVFLTLNNNITLNTNQNPDVDYLNIPLIPEELQFFIKNWKRKRFLSKEPSQTQFPQEFVEKAKKATNQLAIPTLEGYEIIDIDQIIRCEADRNYTYIHQIGVKKPYLISKNLKDFEKALSPNGFLRIHNSHLINPIYIKKILKADGGLLQMVDSAKIRISRNKALAMEKLFINITRI